MGRGRRGGTYRWKELCNLQLTMLMNCVCGQASCIVQLVSCVFQCYIMYGLQAHACTCTSLIRHLRVYMCACVASACKTYTCVSGVISCQVKQHMHLMFLIWLNFSICIGLHMSSHFPILYVHNLNGCRITQH